jgi:effector-binding domain-containing protein
MKKKIGIFCSVVLFLFLGWYFGIKASDYTITFTAKAASGTVFQGIQEWSNIQKQKRKEHFTVVEKNNFDYLKQQMTVGDTAYTYVWEITPLNDSVSKVSVGINENGKSWYNKITAPFFATKFRTEQIRKVKDLREGLNEHLKNLKVRIDGDGTSKPVYVAYIQLKSVLQEKAQTMIGNDAAITGFLYTHKIKIIDRPYVEIVDWDLDTEAIVFNYCFPIDPSTKAIVDANVKFKTIPALKGLKATYYGNFRTSDRAWFALMDYAKKHDLKIKNTALEHFLANPFNGGEELEWETQIIMPFASN